MNKQETKLIIAGLLALSETIDQVTTVGLSCIRNTDPLNNEPDLQQARTISNIAERLDSLHKYLTDFLIQKGAPHDPRNKKNAQGNVKPGQN